MSQSENRVVGCPYIEGGLSCPYLRMSEGLCLNCSPEPRSVTEADLADAKRLSPRHFAGLGLGVDR